MRARRAPSLLFAKLEGDIHEAPEFKLALCANGFGVTEN